MSIKATSKGSGVDFEPVPAGSHVARCISIIHIGTVAVEWEGETKYLNKVRISFELPNETKEFKEGEGEKPYMIAAEYTLSTHERAKLREVAESWKGRKMTSNESMDFEVSDFLGMPAMLNVIHKVGSNGKTYANIASVSPMPKGFECPPAFNKLVELTYLGFNWDIFNSLPDWLKAKIESSDEFRMLNAISSETEVKSIRHIMPKVGHSNVKEEEVSKIKEKVESKNEEINIDDIPF